MFSRLFGSFTSSNTGDEGSANKNANNKIRIQGSVYIALSVDGYVATKSGDVSFLEPYQNEGGPGTTTATTTATAAEGDNENVVVVEQDEFAFDAFLSNIDVIIMGRKTFEKVLSFGLEETSWPYGTRPMVIWTRSKSSLPPRSMKLPDYLKGNVTFCHLPPHEMFQWLSSTMTLDDKQQQQQPDPTNKNKQYLNAYIDGGYTVRAFLQAGLIHEMILTRVPVLLGDGIPLFDDNKNNATTTMTSSNNNKSDEMKENEIQDDVVDGNENENTTENEDETKEEQDHTQEQEKATNTTTTTTITTLQHCKTTAYPNGLVTTRYVVLKPGQQQQRQD